jgi:phosphoglycerate kinase
LFSRIWTPHPPSFSSQKALLPNNPFIFEDDIYSFLSRILLMIRSVTDLDVQGKKVLVRVDFNVPLHEDGTITDDKRIVESLPTIENLTSRGAIVILMSHLGRPKGKRNLAYSLAPVAAHLRTLTTAHVHFADDCIGEAAQSVIASANPGDIVLLENVRFYAEEEANDADFITSLAHLGDMYVNDAFGTAHRAHATTTGIASHFTERAAGLLMQKELQYLGDALGKPQRPFTAILGGSKVSGKIDVIRQLMNNCDTILIGGGMMFTFYKAMGYETGSSLVEADKVSLAKDILDAAKAQNVHLLLPTDAVIANAFSNEAERTIVTVDHIPAGWMGLDIGPATCAAYTEAILSSKTIVWNGPMGVFEMSNFAAGTLAVAQALTQATAQGAITVIGGGDSAAAIAQFGLEKQVSHVSTGGGASLEFLEGKPLPGVEALSL